MAKKKDEKDVLVVRDEKTGEISVVAGLNADGTPKRTRSNNRKAATNTLTLRCGAPRTPPPTTPARKPRKIFRFLLPACPVPAGLP